VIITEDGVLGNQNFDRTREKAAHATTNSKTLQRIVLQILFSLLVFDVVVVIFISS
jgi:hypothetical protein